ncbi:hypothetical protein FQN54_002395 [Arachnomyces sp. PD_36]|nr:hypothetical protein FQN54_002395 [Arachnomyces sp. PD_36]
MRPGIYAIVAFHGQEYGPGRRPPVDGNDHTGENRRARIMRCNTGDDSTESTICWYPGNLPNDAVAEFPLWARTLTRFGNYLFDEDLATEQTFAGNTRGQLQAVRDPSDPCPRLYFEWGGYTWSRQFTPDGGTTGQPNN